MPMSSESSLNPELIEETRRQIRTLMNEVSQLAKSDIEPADFYGEFLTRVVTALAAVGGAVWALNENGQLALQHQINIQETGLRDSEEAQAQHARLLYKAVGENEGMLVPPQSGAGEPDEQGVAPGNPTDFLLVLSPMTTNLETVGLVEIFQRSDTRPVTQKGYLRFLGQMCEIAGEYLKTHQLRHYSDRQSLWTRLEDFTFSVHQGLDRKETAFTIANEGRRLIECDRVSVAIARGSKCKVEAVSGQDVFDKRSNIIRLLNQLSTAVVATGDPIWYTGDTSEMAPQVEDAIQEYIDESHSKMVAVLPLRGADLKEQADAEIDSNPPDPQPPVGAVIIEQIEDSRAPASLKQRVEVVCRHGGEALSNAMEHNNLFLMPLWRMLGKATWVLRARTLPKTVTISAAIIGVILFFIFWQRSFTVEAPGTIEPVDQQEIYSEIGGTIMKVHVEHGQIVDKDQLLATLENVDYDVEVEKLNGDILSTQKQLQALLYARTDENLTEEERSKVYGEIPTVEERLRSLRNQQILLKEKGTKLEVRSPRAGQIVTWDVKDRLTARTVQPGQKLMRVANTIAAWQIELKMPEDRMGYIVEHLESVYDRLRGELEDTLAEQNPNATTEQIEATAADVPNESLSAEIRRLRGTELLESLKEQVPPLVEDLNKQLVETNDLIQKKLTAGTETAESDQTDLETKTDEGPSLKELTEKGQMIQGVIAQLNGVLGAMSYEDARIIIEQLIPPITDATIRSELRVLLDDGYSDRLKVDFILATDPGTTHQGIVEEIHDAAEIEGEEGNTVLIKVSIDDKNLPARRPGAEVTAKVYCGRSSLAFYWFHDIIGFIQSRLLF